MTESQKEINQIVIIEEEQKFHADADEKIITELNLLPAQVKIKQDNAQSNIFAESRP